MIAIKQFGVIRVIAFLRFSILKWWYCIDWFSCLSFRVRRWELSFFGHMKTIEMYSPVECVVFSMIPLSRKHSVCWSMISTSNGFKLYWLGIKHWVGCSFKSIVTPLIAGVSLSFEAAVACKLSPVAVKYVAHGHVLKARKGLRI